MTSTKRITITGYPVRYAGRREQRPRATIEDVYTLDIRQLWNTAEIPAAAEKVEEAAE